MLVNAEAAGLYAKCKAEHLEGPEFPQRQKLGIWTEVLGCVYSAKERCSIRNL